MKKMKKGKKLEWKKKRIKERSVGHGSNYGPLFGDDSDLYLGNNFTNNNSNYSYFPYFFKDERKINIYWRY